MFKGDYEKKDHKHSAELVERYEAAVLAQQSVYFDDDSMELIVEHYHNANRLSEALTAAEFALGLNPYHAFHHLRKAEILLELKRFDAAYDSTELAAVYDPAELEVYLIRSDISLNQGKHAEAIEHLELALIKASGADKEQIFLEMAEVYENGEQFDNSFDCLSQVLQINPLCDEALNKIWYFADLTDKYEDSLELHKEIIDKEPYCAQAWQNLAKAWFGLGLYERADEALGFALAINENDASAWRDKGEVLYRMQDYPAAISAFMDGLDRDGMAEELYFKIARSYEKLFQYPVARFNYRKAIQLDPYFDDAYFRIAMTYLAENAEQLALNNVRKACQINPENAEYRTVLGQLYQALDLETEAVACFRQAVALRPDLPSNWIQYSKLLYQSGDTDAALLVAEEALDKCGEHAHLVYLQSGCLLASGRKNEGAVKLGRAMELDEAAHLLLFDYFPELEDNPAVLRLIAQYKS